MLRTLSILVGAILLAGGLSGANSKHVSAVGSTSGDDDRLVHAYMRVRNGMPVSGLGTLGFDTETAEHLSKAVLLERFMPKDRIAFSALDPAIKNCYLRDDDCTAYIFDVYTKQAVLLVQGGRVTWKMLSDSIVI